MTWIGPLALLQAAAFEAELGRIATAQVVMAAATVVAAVVLVGGAVVGFSLLRSARRTALTVERLAERLAPRVEPLLVDIGRVAEDAREISRMARLESERLRETVEGLDTRLRAAVDEAEARVRQAGAVLRVVQEEMEALLLDGAATARGLHATSERLRRPRSAGRATRRPEVDPDVPHGGDLDG